MSRSRSDLLRTQWKIMRDWVNMYLDALTDEELSHPIVDGRNHGMWILGHLIASDDTLTQYLGLGGMLFPDRQSFAQSENPTALELCPPVSQLRDEWKQVCEKNEAALRSLKDEVLDEPHAMVAGDPDDDYFKTKERVVINWTLHQVHHAGQLALLLGSFGRRTI